MDAFSHRYTRILTIVLCGVALLLAGAVLNVQAGLPAVSAYAATVNTSAEANDLQQQVESATAAYAEATSALEELESQIEQNSARIADIQENLPMQRAQSAHAMIMLYKLNQEGFSLVDMLLGCGDLTGFIRNTEYVTHVHEKYTREASEAARMEAELTATQKQLQDAKAEVLERQQEAVVALAAAQAAREQAIAASKATMAAEIEKMEREEATHSEETYEPTTPPVDDGVTGTEDRASFIASWAPRIDAYLSGSPLAGQGATFAAAAWDFGVDPRFSPAISCVESSKGAYCFLPCNAWGWGSCSWSCWEDAIRDHVAGLARGYGYSVSVAGAQKYCPPNWEFWYNSVSSQMNMI